jgi:CBS domain containing-hemolysin-like protein
MIGGLLVVLLFAAAFVYSGLEAAWQALDRVRLRHRAEKGDRRAGQMAAWEAVQPQAPLVLAWTANVLAAAALVTLILEVDYLAGERLWWLAPAVFLPAYALLVQVLARQIFRRMPFFVLGRWWWLVRLAGSFWAPLARPMAGLLRRVKPDPLPQLPAGEELLLLAEKTEGISPLEQSMLRSVLDFRLLTAGSLALPVDDFPRADADVTLGQMLTDRQLEEARHVLIIGADGQPLGAMSCGAAALSGAHSARAQSFARPLLSFPADLPAWKTLAGLRRSPTPVAEVRDVETGRLLGVLSDQTVVARLLGQAV